ncbi:exported hypothetical protein [Agrobacterium fabacearum TT111]|nr:exported hypothetical protein [Agrobacterium fabacearum TT111]
MRVRAMIMTMTICYGLAAYLHILAGERAQSDASIRLTARCNIRAFEKPRCFRLAIMPPKKDNLRLTEEPAIRRASAFDPRNSHRRMSRPLDPRQVGQKLWLFAFRR